jgi:proteasome lid subunit RPN8/RPN11
MAFFIFREQAAAVRAHAVREYPHEACGILLGQEHTVAEIITCTNDITDRTDRYRIPPAELIAAQKRARASGIDILGFYHSHPDHPPAPSITDLAEAHWFGCVYLIIEVESRLARAMRAFLLTGNEQRKQFTEIEISVRP